jgi:hypothetical protein
MLIAECGMLNEDKHHTGKTYRFLSIQQSAFSNLFPLPLWQKSSPHPQSLAAGPPRDPISPPNGTIITI